MSERNHAPRSGGRAAEPRRGTARGDGLGRNADAQEAADREAAPRRSADREAAPRRSAARGVRHFADGETPADTRRSGIAGERRTGATRSRDTAGVRAKARDTDGVRAKARDTAGVRAKARDTDGVRAKARDRNPVGGLGRGMNAGRDATPVRDRKSAAAGRKSRMADALGGRRRVETPGGSGRRRVTDAPVDGTAALDIEVTAGEPLRVEQAAPAPRLRVAPPAPISAPRAPFVAAVLSVVVIGVLGILVINTKTNENSFRINDLQKQGSLLANQQQDLENQLVAASHIGSLDAAARRLGMVKAEQMAIIRMPDGKMIGVPGPAKGPRSVTYQETEDEKATSGQAPENEAGQNAGAGQNPGAGQQPAAGQQQPAAGQQQPGTGQ